MRIQNSIKNIYVGIISQVVITLLGFISRKIFIDNLGAEYLGLNGLLTNILAMLSLVEGGIGTSIVYCLYKPLAEDNKEEIIALIQLYKRLYSIIAILIGFLSIILYPVIYLLIEENNQISYIGTVYFIFVIKNIISYLNAHKWSLINADQKGYIIGKYNIFFNILLTIVKIIILKSTKNYVLYLIVDLIVVFIQNIWNGNIVNKIYPYILVKEKYKIDKSRKKSILLNVKALFLHNIATYFVFGTDNILITTFINLKTVGIYSNYTMIINQLTAILKPCINGIGESVGNLIAVENKTKKYEIFKCIYMINFWIYGFITIVLYNILQPFINTWLGKGHLVDDLTFIVILLNFYITGLRSPISMFKNKAGIFKNDQYFPLAEAVLNLFSSLLLVKYYDLAGIFLGTTISTLAIPFWTQPKLVYNKIFNRSSIEYFFMYIKYFLIMILTCFIATLLCNKLLINNLWISIFIKGGICTIGVNTIFILCFYNTSEFQYIFKILQINLKNFFNKRKEIDRNNESMYRV